MSTVALRTALIWHDEVMNDVVSAKPAAITLGDTGKSTFVVPPIGLPPNFAIVRPGNRGYLLTLGEHMRGTICLDGEQKDVAEFVRRGGEGGDGPGGRGGFAATAISGRDWGVIDLDESGAYKLFFQFVPVEDASPFLSGKVQLAGLMGWLLSGGALAFVMYRQKADVTLEDAIFTGFLLSTLALIVGGIAWSLIRQDGESQASLAFSVLFHAALLFMTYQLYDGEDPFVWPGPRSLTGNYLVTRLEPEPPPDPPKAAASTGKVAADSAPKSPEKATKNPATKGEQGAAGGKGPKERASDEHATGKVAPPAVALISGKNKQLLADVANIPIDTGSFNNLGMTRTGSLGSGTSSGTGFGPGENGSGTTRGGKGKGPGGGGQAIGDFNSKAGPIDTGKVRPGGDCTGPNCKGIGPKQISVGMSGGHGDFNGLSKDEVDRIVKSRGGLFRACYQKLLNVSPGAGGTVDMHFVINGDGAVTAVSTNSGSSLKNGDLETCIKRQIQGLKFPAKGGANVTSYPFVFSPGG